MVVTHDFEASREHLCLRTTFYRIAFKIKCFAPGANNAPIDQTLGNPNFDANMMLGKDGIFIFPRRHKTPQGELCSMNNLQGNLHHVRGIRVIGTRRKNGGKTIACEIRNKTALLIHQGHRGLEYKVEGYRQFFSAFRTFLHEFFGQTGKTAEVDKHRAGLKLARKNTVTVIFLNEMWQEVFQISIEKLSGLQVTTICGVSP